MAIESIKNNESITQTYGKIIDPFLANAFYMPDENTITITLGYLFSNRGDFRTYSTEELYSSLGFVMGHELTHGFDSNGSYYDKNGKKLTTSILPEADDKIFKEKQVQVIKNYDKKECCTCEFFANDEKITISEAMADIGGFSLVLEMAKNNNNFNYKSFFKYVAKRMASKKSVLVTAFTYTDVHPFGKVRSNTLLSNSDKFISTFDIKPDDAMWMEPENRVTIW
jgi:putative endopeptidase